MSGIAKDARTGGPIRIAHVVFSLGIGGLESGIINLLGHFDRREFQHKIFCMKALGPNAERAISLGAEVEQIGTLEGKNRDIIPKLRRAFRAFRPHIVHSRNFGCLDAVIAARLARVPRVVHGEHGWDTFDPNGTNKKRRFLRGALSTCVSRYICVSSDLARWLGGHRGFFKNKITTIINGVDVTRFMPTEETPVTASGPMTFLSVGRLVPIKDQARLIDAFARAAKTRPALRLELVGDGELRSALEQRAQQSAFAERIAIRGGTQTPESAYRSAQVFVLPSLNEGISNTILEAMSSGLPVIATRVGGNPELVSDGVTGLLVPKEDTESLAQAIARYADEPALAQQHGRSGRMRAVSEFSLSRMAGAYRQVYLDVLGRHLCVE